MNQNEETILRYAVRELAKVGYKPRFVVAEDISEDTPDEEAVIRICRDLDEATIQFTKDDGEAEPWFFCIFDNGNDGLDVLADWTTIPKDFDEALDATLAWVEKVQIVTLPVISLPPCK